MNKIFGCLLVAGTLAIPALSFAQDNTAPITRAQVRAELVGLEQVGYNPATGEDTNYPTDIQAAEAKVAGQTQMAETTSAVGGVASGGSSQAGARVRAPAACVGPVSFCNTFFGN
jgi:hypothetical protein